MLTLSELVRSSAAIISKRGVHSYSMPKAMLKEFGTIYYNNKVVIYNPDTKILEIRMGIGTKTETAYKGMHSVRMAIYGVEGEIYNSLEELYNSKVGDTPDVEDLNKMKKSIKGETDIGTRRAQALKAEDRFKYNQQNKNNGINSYIGGRKLSEPYDVNKFQVRYKDETANAFADLSGYIIPVASINPNTGAYTYSDSGQIFYMEKPIDPNSYVRVSCSCSSYYFTMAWYNYAEGCHLGPQPAAYPGKTDYSETVLNRYKTPGMCKHLMMFTMLLLNGGILNNMKSKNYTQNLDLIMNRPEKLSISKKLADKGDWNNHVRQLQHSLRMADNYHKTTYKWNKDMDSIKYDKMVREIHPRLEKKYDQNPLKDFARDMLNMTKGKYVQYRTNLGDLNSLITRVYNNDTGQIEKVLKEPGKYYNGYKFTKKEFDSSLGGDPEI